MAVGPHARAARAARGGRRAAAEWRRAQPAPPARERSAAGSSRVTHRGRQSGRQRRRHRPEPRAPVRVAVVRAGDGVEDEPLDPLRVRLRVGERERRAVRDANSVSTAGRRAPCGSPPCPRRSPAWCGTPAADPAARAHAAPAPVERSRASRSIARQRRSPLAPVPRWSNPITLKRSSSNGTVEQDVDHLDDPRAARAAREVHEVLGTRGRRTRRGQRAATPCPGTTPARSSGTRTRPRIEGRRSSRAS